ncbi:MAG: histidine kinase N-terminal 7TM domain-containing protein [Oscillochloridaceae bacterium]|nr:ATP-binding protein [Chloroflexaceae bacterium]MDW8392105.1 histidine kinase N-terminal 7TM domain-containing protein [Oscillochloridaceae bacterium]
MPEAPFVLLYLALAIAASLLAAIAWRRRYYRSSRPLTLLMGALAYWCSARALAIADPRFEGTVFWALMQVGGIAPIMPAWLLLALSYTGQRWRRHLPVLTAIFVPAAVFFVLAMSNSLHRLWWTEVAPDTSRGFMWLRLAWGPAFWVHTGYAYCCFIVSTAFLAHAAARRPAPERRLAWLVLLASLIPTAGNIAYLAGARPIGPDDPTPILLLFSGLIALYAILRSRVVDLEPLVAREALAALPDGIIVLDNDQRVAEMNGAAARLLDTDERVALGRPLADLLAERPLGMALQPILGNLGQPSTHLASYTDQARYTIEVRVRPLKAANGAVAGALLLLRDVSERMQAEQSRAQHLAELSLINRVARVTNTAPDAEGLVRAAAATIAAAGVWDRVTVGLLTPDGARLDVVADVAAEGTDRGYEGQSVRGAEAEALIALLRSGESHILDLSDPATSATTLGRAVANEGIGRLLLVPLFHRGAPLGMLALGTVTPQPGSTALPRVAETIGELITDAVVRARLYDEVRQADRLKTSFLASVSHELRNPLTSIIGYIEMFRRGIYGPLDERYIEPLQYMHLSSTTLLRMINDILDFTRAEAGHLHVELQPVNVRHIVANVIGQLQPQIRERGLAFDLEIAPDLPLAQGNKMRLEQIVTNLLSNAIKFTEEGRITVRACQVNDRVRLSVTDTGIGIAPEHLEVIFQEFRRVETAARRVKGAGLGLAISRRLVELMGGTISVESAPGEGSTFTVELPIAPVASHGVEGPHTKIGDAEASPKRERAVAG